MTQDKARIWGPCTVLGMWLLAATAIAQDATTTGTSWNGGNFAYPGGNAEITHVTLILQSDSVVPLHCHPVPTMGYVVRGRLAVETSDGDSIEFGPGDRLVEVMKTVHHGVVVSAPVELVVFYAGAEGMPNTVLADSDQAAEYCAP